MRRLLKRYFTVSRFTTKLLSLPLALLAAVSLRLAILLPTLYDVFASEQSIPVRSALAMEGMQGLVLTVTAAFVLGCAVFLAGSIVAFVRKPRALSGLRSCYIAGYALALLWFFAAFRFTGVVFDAEMTRQQPMLDRMALFYWRWDLLWPAGALVLLLGAAHLISWRKANIAVYTGFEAEEPAPGDRLIENIRTHGREPRFRKSMWLSAFSHLAVIVLIPILLLWLKGGCVEDYRVPYGEGEPVVISMVKKVQPNKKPKVKRILNPMSAIYFHEPDFDLDSEIQKEVEEQTQLTWSADPASAHGKMGAGKGTKGGWPDGMKDGLIRFIRLEYDGENWNDGMDLVSRADRNFLEEFHKVTGFKVAHNGESHPISSLAKYNKGRAPPFVYMTGSNRINVSPRDVKILREYLLDGGMLFADCGGARWHRNFLAFIQAVFPGEPLLVVSDDDPIYQMPYTFANGAPPLWHHGGTRALGIKRGNRWVVYYHPGDVNDAWKTGHSGLKPQLAKAAFQLGINVVYHAFTNYLDATRKYRK